MIIETLVRMADQIAANNRALPQDQAVTKIAGHLQAFWTPTMIADLQAYSAFDGPDLDPLVTQALDLLRPEPPDGA